MHIDDLRLEREPLLGPGAAKKRSMVPLLLFGALALLLGGACVTARSQHETTTTKQFSSEAPHSDAAWSSFKKRYGKIYATPEDEKASRANYEARLAALDELNRKNGAEVFGVTEHADRPLNAKAYARGRRPRVVERDALRTHPGRVQLEPATGAPSDGVDWRLDSRGVVTPVKNQGQCGSCWAESAAEQIESQFVLAGAPAVELSPQQLTSCTPFVDGCGGGDPSAAYEYLIDGGTGLAPEAFWPYTQALTPDGECEDIVCTHSCNRDLDALVESYEFIGPYAVVTSYGFAVPECAAGACAAQNLTALAARLSDSPISVCVNAETWDDYTGGVLTAAACGGSGADDIDHCVQLVGFNNTFGDDAATQPYWILRNSWSADWGIDGDIYLQYDANTCGLANEATLVQVDGQWSDPEAA